MDAIIGMFLFYLIIYIVGFTLGAFGGMFSECSGIINIALEGSMVIGTFAGIIFKFAIITAFPKAWLCSTYMGLQLLMVLSAIVAIIAGILFSYLLSFVSIKLKANQTIVGTAMNTLATAICAILNTVIRHIDSAEVINSFPVPNPFTGVPFLSNLLGKMHLGLLIGIAAIVICWLAMNRTRFGLRLRACGENPLAAASVGVNVNRMRYTGTAIGSACAALGGFVIFSSTSLSTNWIISALGYGFLVLAIEIFGNWKAKNIFFASIFFAFFFAFAPTFTSAINLIPNRPNNIFTSKYFYYMLPYLLAFLTLVVFSKKSHCPKAEGIPYDKSTR